MTSLSKLTLALTVCALVSACASSTKPENVNIESIDGAQSGEITVSGLDGESGAITGGLDDGSYGSQGSDASSLANLSQSDLLSRRVVYFEYDSRSLTLEGEQIVQAHAQYLLSAPGIRVILEGHADERGTREYNLALGEDRGKSVASVLQAFGVASNRIDVVSFGEERPAVAGNDDGAWALNRRVEILYQ